MNTSRFERGQVLVLIVLAIVGMLGFAALSVDIGRVFAERRRAQSAADTAAMAAANAGSVIADQTAREAAARGAADSQLQLNDYLDPTINTDEGQKLEIEVRNPPVSGPYQGDKNYYQVFIHQNVDKVFSQFVYTGPLKFTVEAVAQSDVAKGMFDGQALVATCKDCCQALNFSGGAETRIKGGDALSLSSAGATVNSCTPGDPEGAASCTSGDRSGEGDVVLDEGHTITVHGTWRDSGNSGAVYTQSNPPGTLTPLDPDQCSAVEPVDLLPPPICGAYRTVPAGVPIPGSDWIQYTLNPGTYNDEIRFNTDKAKVHLNPGLYCLNDGIVMLNGSITADGVMFYMEGGSFNLGGGTIVNLYGATDLKGAWVGGEKDPDYQWGGMLLYMPYENSSEVHIGGGSSSTYTGTIYAPGPRPTSGQDKCIIEGSGTNLGLASAVICDTIKITGDAQININYQADTNFHFPPSLSMSQ